MANIEINYALRIPGTAETAPVKVKVLPGAYSVIIVELSIHYDTTSLNNMLQEMVKTYNLDEAA